MIEYIVRHKGNSLRCLKGFFPVDVPNLFVINVCIRIHRFNIVHTERQNILIIDGIYYGIRMKLIPKSLLSRKILRIHPCSCIRREDRCPRETEHIILFETLYNGIMHIAELAAVAFVKDYDNLFPINFMLFILLDEGRELLNGCNNNMCLWIPQLPLQNRRRGIAVSSTFLKSVIFLHGLIVQILTVNNKEHFINKRKLCG